MANFVERDERCVFVGNLEARVTEEILWELFLQAGPLEAVHIPKDKETGKQKTYGFVSFSSEVSAPYAICLMDGIPLYGRPISVNHAAQNGNSNSTGNQSPSNYGFMLPDDSQLRRPLFDNPSGQFSPRPVFGTPPPLLIDGAYRNFQQGFSSPRGQWDIPSPWQQNGGQGYPRRNSPQSGRLTSPQFCQMPNRQLRPYYSQ